MRILIAGFTTRALAESAVRAGAEVVAVDYFGDLDQKRLCESHALRERGHRYSAAAILEVAQELAYDAVVYGGGLENHPAVVGALARGRVLLGNDPETLRRVRAPSDLLRHLAAEGFLVPDTRRASDPLPPGRGRSAKDSSASGPASWLLKPARGGGGQGVRHWDGRPPAAGHVLQERIEGTSASAAFVADGRRCAVLAWSEQLHPARGFRYAGNVIPLEGPAAARREVEAIAGVLTREYGLRGLNGFDFVLRGDRPVVLEVNPRYCASMELVERASGASVFGLHRDACRGEVPAVPGVPPGYWGKAVVYAARTVTAPDTTGWPGRGLRDVPHPGEVIHAGHPICTVLASAPTRALCHARLEAEAARVRAACAPAGPAPGRADAEDAQE